MKLTKPIRLQILFNIWLVCWILSLVLDATWLLWVSAFVTLTLSAVVLCWGRIKIKRGKRCRFLIGLMHTLKL
jgi:hypothetical protein